MSDPAASPSRDDLEWRESYAIGVAALDTQHQRLLAILRRLEDFRRTGGSPLRRLLRQDQLAALLDELNEYATYHFFTEEDMMRKHLPATGTMAQHLAEHRNYWKQLHAFQQEHDGGTPEVPAALFDFLCTWWVSHILHADRLLGKALNDKRIF